MVTAQLNLGGKLLATLLRPLEAMALQALTLRPLGFNCRVATVRRLEGTTVSHTSVVRTPDGLPGGGIDPQCLFPQLEHEKADKRRKRKRGSGADGWLGDNLFHACDVIHDGWVTLDAVVSKRDVEWLCAKRGGLRDLHLGGAVFCAPDTCANGAVLGTECQKWRVTHPAGILGDVSPAPQSSMLRYGTAVATILELTEMLASGRPPAPD